MKQELNNQIQKLSYSNIDALCLLHKSPTIKDIFPQLLSFVKISKIDLKQNLFQQLSHTSFPTLCCSILDLTNISTQILMKTTFCMKNTKKTDLNLLIREIAKGYNIVSYHNFSHAFSLMLLIYQCLQRSPSMKSMLSQEQYAWTLLAALAHDLNHPGTNNAFEIKRKTPWALQVNNIAVLQQMHLRTFWSILQRFPDLNVLKFAKDQVKTKQFITNLILNTDNAKHYDNLKALSNIDAFDKTNPVHKQIYMINLFHGCDIGNGCVNYQTYISWTALVHYQFKVQTQLQQQMALEVTQMMVYKGPSTIFNDQLWFLPNMVIPLWKQLHFIFQQIEPMLNNLKTNLALIQKNKPK